MRMVMSLIFMLMTPALLNAQNVGTDVVSVRGRVVDDVGDAIPGAMIYQKDNTTNGAVADNEGAYDLRVAVGSTVVVSFVGYETKEFEIVPNQTTYDVVLSIEAHNLRDVVVIG